MCYSGILFDLFGTLVPPFRKREHEETIRNCAERLGIDFAALLQYWTELYPERVRGKFASVADQFAWVLRLSGLRASRDTLGKAEDIYAQYTIGGLKPMAGVLETLAWCKSNGMRIGLVSNCAPDVVHIWENTAFAPYFDYCAFSCQLGVVKPEPEIYLAALNALGLSSGETAYVGDGSDEELTGAARVGMRPVLVAADLSNTYDSKRKDVDAWRGPTIRSLSELPALLAGME